MDEHWWIRIFQWALFTGAMAIVTGWLAKSRVKQRTTQDENALRHPLGLLVLGLVGLAFFGGIAMVSTTVGRNDTTSIGTTSVFLFFATMSLLLIAEYFFARHRLSADGIDFGKLHGQRGYARWTEIRAVQYAPAMKWFHLRTESGATIRISAMLMGLPLFAEHVLAYVPPERIDGPTRDLLLETAAGNPPSIW